MAQAKESKRDKVAHRVLLYVQTAEDVSILQDILAGIGAEGVVCTDIAGLCRQIAHDADAVLLTEQSAVDGALPVLAEVLQGQPEWSDLPVLFVAAGGAESPWAVQAMQELRNVVILDRPVRIATLAGVLRMGSGVRDKQRQVRDLLQERDRQEQRLRQLTEHLEDEVEAQTRTLTDTIEKLRQLTLELSQTEDRERKHLAEILHDDLQQLLAAAKFHVGLVSRRAKGDEELLEMVGQVKAMLVEAIEKSRSLSHELSPPGLSKSDLHGAFKWLGQQFQMKHGLMVLLDAREGIELPSEPLRAILYKAAQEMLFNVVKYAGVKEATLRLRRRGGYIWLFVSDRGRGFDPDESGRTGGFGLLSIRERVKLLGGRMKVRSAKGKGSTFLIIVPDSQPQMTQPKNITIQSVPRRDPGTKTGQHSAVGAS